MNDDLIYENLIYFSLTFPDGTVASKSFFGLSNDKFEDLISEEANDAQVIYLESNPLAWSNGGKQHSYMWKHNFSDLAGIAKRIKSVNLIHGKDKNCKNNCFELNLQTGVLSPKILNEEKRRGRRDRGNAENKIGTIVLFLGPEQIKHFQMQNTN